MRTTGNFAGFPAYLKIGLSGNAAASYNCINTRPTARAHGQATREAARRQSVGGVQPGGACDIAQVEMRTCAHHACRKAIGKSPVSAAGQALGKGFACAQTYPMIWHQQHAAGTPSRYIASSNVVNCGGNRHTFQYTACEHLTPEQQIASPAGTMYPQCRKQPTSGARKPCGTGR